jgi:protein-L-isoaspartate O-methyltransferase
MRPARSTSGAGAAAAGRGRVERRGRSRRSADRRVARPGRRRGQAKGIANRREQLLAGPTGRVLEVGAGSGLGFAQFPASVTELVAIEPEPYLRRLAQAAVSEARIPITVIDARAEDLPFAEGEFDGA